jgi:hypothetical protein
MFTKRWPWLGRLISGEEFEIYFGHKTVYYGDSRGKFALDMKTGFSFRNLIRFQAKPRS